VLFCFSFAFGTAKQLVYVFLGHDVLLIGLGESVLLVVRLIEFTSAIFPKSVRVDGSEDMGHITGQGCYNSDFFVFSLLATHILFAMHINDYYYNTILTLSQSLNTYLYKN